MANLECPQCGNALANGAAVCGICGKEVNDDENASSPQAKSPSRKNIYAILAVFLAVAGGVVLLIFTGLLPNPMKGGSTVAIINGEKISIADVDQKFEVYQKMSGKSGCCGCENADPANHDSGKNTGDRGGKGKDQRDSAGDRGPAALHLAAPLSPA